MKERKQNLKMGNNKIKSRRTKIEILNVQLPSTVCLIGREVKIRKEDRSEACG